MWDIQAHRSVGLLHSGNTCVEFSPDGSLLASADLREYRLFETGTWRRRHRIVFDNRTDLPGVVCFSPDGRLLAVTRSLFEFDLVSPGPGELLATFHSPMPAVINVMHFSPDSRLLAVGTTANQVQVWDLDGLHYRLRAMGLDWDSTVE